MNRWAIVVRPCGTLDFGPALEAKAGGIFGFSSVHAALSNVAGRSGVHFSALVSGGVPVSKW